jgi:hypothetical protein
MSQFKPFGEAHPEWKPFDPSNYLIKEIMQKRQLSLMAGPSGVGKTTFLIQMLKDWQQGKKLFDLYESYPANFLYVSNDRTGENLDVTKYRLGVDFPSLVMMDMARPPDKIEGVIRIARALDPKVELIILDTILDFFKGNINDYQDVKDFLQQTTKLCGKNKVTILGIGHSPKLKEGESYPDPRNKLLGSSAWPAFVDTIFVFDAVGEGLDDRKYRVRLLPRNSGEKEFWFVKDEKGLFVPTIPEKEKELARKETLKMFMMDRFLDSKEVGREWETKEAMAWGEKKGLSAKTIQRWLEQIVMDRRAEKNARGVYSRIDKPTPEEPGQDIPTIGKPVGPIENEKGKGGIKGEESNSQQRGDIISGQYAPGREGEEEINPEGQVRGEEPGRKGRKGRVDGIKRRKNVS